MQMTKKELKYVNSLKEENDRVKNLLLCFVNAIKEVQTTEDIEKIWLIPCLGEKAKKVRAEIKAEAYKEVEEKLSETTWYRISQKGELVVGANSETDIPLYKAEDVYNLLKELIGE